MQSTWLDDSLINLVALMQPARRRSSRAAKSPARLVEDGAWSVAPASQWASPPPRPARKRAADAPPLFGRMMGAIRTGHSLANTVRMLKLPLIFLEEQLYADAIAQFFWLIETLEAALRRRAADPLVQRVLALELDVAPGFAADLRALHRGAGWRAAAARARTAATSSYCELISAADADELVGAAFVLYGALVIGGGKATQAKVRRAFARSGASASECEHRLYDVAGDMPAMRRRFKEAFTRIGEEHPDRADALEEQAGRFMARNNTVLLSIRCWGRRAAGYAWGAAACVGAVAAAAWLDWYSVLA